MKFVVLGLALLAVCASAYPEVHLQGRLSEGEQFAENFKKVIEAFQRFIIRRNLDPANISSWEHLVTADPFLRVRILVEGFRFSGVSNVKVNELSYSNLYSTMTFDLELPVLDATLSKAGIEGTVLGNTLKADIGGILTINNIRLQGAAQVEANIITGTVNIKSLNANFSIRKITSALIVNALGNDYSDRVNRILNEVIPDFLKKEELWINGIISRILKFLTELYLAVRK